MARRKLNRRWANDMTSSTMSDSELDYVTHASGAVAPVTLRVKTFRMRHQRADDVTRRSARCFALYASTDDLCVMTSQQCSRQVRGQGRKHDRRYLASKPPRLHRQTAELRNWRSTYTGINRSRQSTGNVTNDHDPVSRDDVIPAADERKSLAEFLASRKDSAASLDDDCFDVNVGSRRGSTGFMSAHETRVASDVSAVGPVQGHPSSGLRCHQTGNTNQRFVYPHVRAAVTPGNDVEMTKPQSGDVTRTLSTDSGYQSPPPVSQATPSPLAAVVAAPAWLDVYARVSSHDFKRVNAASDVDVGVLRDVNDQLEHYLFNAAHEVS